MLRSARLSPIIVYTFFKNIVIILKFGLELCNKTGNLLVNIQEELVTLLTINMTFLLQMKNNRVIEKKKSLKAPVVLEIKHITHVIKFF